MSAPSEQVQQTASASSSPEGMTVLQMLHKPKTNSNHNKITTPGGSSSSAGIFEIVDLTTSTEGPSQLPWASKEGLTKRQAEDIEIEVDKKIRVSNRDYACSCCNEKFFLSEILPLYPGWFNWQGSFVQLCFECCQARRGPPGPLRIMTGETKNGAAKLGPMATNKMLGADSQDLAAPARRSGEIESNEWALVPYNPSLDCLEWVTPSAPGDPTEPCKFPVAHLDEGNWTRTAWYTNKDEAANLKRFRKDARHGWLQRQALLKGNYEHRVRDMKFTRFMTSIFRDNPTDSRRRRLILARGQWWMANVVTSLAKDPEECNNPDLTQQEKQHLRQEKKDKVTKAFSEWERLQCYSAEHVGWQPALAQKVLDVSKAMDHVSTLAEGLQVFYFCNSCGQFCEPTDWPSNGGKYRCPECTILYAPWANGRTAQRIWRIEGLSDALQQLKSVLPEACTSKGTVHSPDEQGLAAEFLSAPDSNGIITEYFLAEWEDWASQQFSDNLKLIYLNLHKELSEMTFDEISKFIADEAAKQRLRSPWNEVEMSHDMIERFKWMNTQGSNATKPFAWKGKTKHMGIIGTGRQFNQPAGSEAPRNMDDVNKFYDHGVCSTWQAGKVYDAVPMWKQCKVPNLDGPVMKQQDIIRFWAYSKFCYEALESVIEHNGALPE